MVSERDLFKLLPESLRNDDRAFSWRDGRMNQWETDVCVWLFINGYESQSFKTEDSDSFGPLVIGVRLRKFGEQEWFLYTYG